LPAWLENAYSRAQDRVLWERVSPPKWGAMSTKPPQNTPESASFELSSLKIRRRVWPVGEFSTKGNNKFLKIPHISPVYTEATPWTNLHRRGCQQSPVTIFGDRLRGVDSVGVENCHLPLTTRPVAVNILRHRTLLVARKIRFSCPKYKEKLVFLYENMQKLQIPLWKSDGDSPKVVVTSHHRHIHACHIE